MHTALPRRTAAFCLSFALSHACGAAAPGADPSITPDISRLSGSSMRCVGSLSTASACASRAFDVTQSDAELRLTHDTTAFARYEAHWEQWGGAVSQGAGVVEAGVFSAFGRGRTSGVWHINAGRTSFTRLDSRWTIDAAPVNGHLALGDSVGVPGAWGRAVRFGGVQWTTHAAASRPGYMDFALPAARGESTVPSVVDLANSVHRGTAVDATDRSPVDGLGQIKLVVRDLLGRWQTVVQPYFVSPVLLDTGAHQSALEAGALRRDYGIEGQRYGQPFAVVTDRLGVSRKLTREWRAELQRDQQTIGAGAFCALPMASTASASLAASRSPDGAGWLASGGIGRQVRGWTASLQSRLTSPHFEQLGESPTFGRSPRELHIVSLRGPAAEGVFGMTLLSQASWGGDRYQSLGASYEGRVGAFGRVQMFAARTTSAAVGLTIGVQFSHPLQIDAGSAS